MSDNVDLDVVPPAEACGLSISTTGYRVDALVTALRASRLVLLLIASFILLPVVLAFLYIDVFGVNVPWDDEFTLIPYFQMLQARTLTLSDLLAQHNEHRILFPRLVMLAYSVVTRFNTKPGMFLYWLCLCGVCALFFAAYVRDNGLSQWSALKFAPVSYLVFSFRQWESFLWGFEIQFGMAVLFTMLAFYLLQVRRHPVLSVVLAAASGVVGSFSAFGGLLVWPIGLGELWYLGTGRLGQQHGRLRYAVWSAVALGVLVLYFHGFTVGRPSLADVLRQPVHGLAFFLALVGMPVSVDPRDATAAGLLLCGFCLYVAFTLRQARQRATRSSALWLAAMLFGVIMAATIALGRSTVWPLVWGISSRYSIYGLVGMAGLYLWLVININWKHTLGAVLGGTMLGLIVLGIAATYPDGIYTGHALLIERRTQAGVARHFDAATDDQLATLGPSVGPSAYRRSLLDYLRNQHLSVFSGSDAADAPPAGPVISSLAETGTSTQFSIDAVVQHCLRTDCRTTAGFEDVVSQVGASLADGSTEVIAMRKGEIITVTGWAVDSTAQHAAGGVVINIDGTRDLRAEYGLDRHDVGAYFGNSAYDSSGFEAGFSARVLGKGRHVLSIKILSSERLRYYWPEYRLILDIRD